jgi:hypothetical protein
MARYWYSYVVTTADPRLSSSYQLIKPEFDPPTCTIGTILCAINSPEGGPFPFSPLSQNLQDYIAASLANGVPQSPPGSKLYVYLKD